MQSHEDKVTSRILTILGKANEPLETREIELILNNITRTKVLYRLTNLRGDGVIFGKHVGSGKGTWIWWK
ncbi:hypothetical protein H6503_06535 [Candidatus Woesearchaeota archaeon]|nr:hypothetical protein [Candidatus Woesearchaeota archaeon]